MVCFSSLFYYFSKMEHLIRSMRTNCQTSMFVCIKWVSTKDWFCLIKKRLLLPKSEVLDWNDFSSERTLMKRRKQIKNNCSSALNRNPISYCIWFFFIPYIERFKPVTFIVTYKCINYKKLVHVEIYNIKRNQYLQKYFNYSVSIQSSI